MSGDSQRDENKNTFYYVSIEPIYSQSVGNYVYLCDSEEKVNAFRNLLRIVGIQCRSDSKPSSSNHPKESVVLSDEECEEDESEEDESEDDDSSGWWFCERVYAIEENDLRKSQDSGICTAKIILSENYIGFRWLKYEMISLSSNNVVREVCLEKDDIPLLNCVNDFVEAELNISLEDFLKNFI